MNPHEDYPDNSINENDICLDRRTSSTPKPPPADGDLEELFKLGNEIVDMFLEFRSPAMEVVPYVLYRECRGWRSDQVRAMISAMTTIIVVNAKRTHDDVESGKIVKKFFAEAAASKTHHPFKGRTKKQIAQSARNIVGTYLDLCDVLQSIDMKFALAQKRCADGESDVVVVI